MSAFSLVDLSKNLSEKQKYLETVQLEAKNLQVRMSGIFRTCRDLLQSRSKDSKIDIEALESSIKQCRIQVLDLYGFYNRNEALLQAEAPKNEAVRLFSQALLALMSLTVGMCSLYICATRSDYDAASVQDVRVLSARARVLIKNESQIEIEPGCEYATAVKKLYGAGKAFRDDPVVVLGIA